MDLKKQLKNNNVNIKNIKIKLNKIEKEIKYLLIYNGVFPSFNYDYKNMISSLTYNINLNSNELTITTSYLINNNDLMLKNITNLKDNYISIEKNLQIMDIQKEIIALSNSVSTEKIIYLLGEYHTYFVKKIELNSEKYEIENNIRMSTKDTKFFKFQEIFPYVENFCIDSFLCKKYGVDFNEKPSIENRKELKLKIIESSKMHNKKIENITFIVCKKHSNFEGLVFNNKILTINIKKGTYCLGSGKNKQTSKIKINESLQKQISYNNKTISRDVLCSQKCLIDFFGVDFMKFKRIGYLEFNYILNELPRLHIKNKVSNF
jgi:hypothetical protein